MEIKTISIKDITPVGNFEKILLKLNGVLEVLESKNEYSSNVADFIKLVVGTLGLTEALSTFEEPYQGWNYEEQRMSLLYTHILVIRANNIAQKYLNNIEMDPISVQFMDYIKSSPEISNIFNDILITE